MIVVIRALSNKVRIMLPQLHRWWPSITSALGKCIVVFLATGGAMHHPHSSPNKHGTITRYFFDVGPESKMLGNIKTVSGKWHVFAWGAAAKYTADPVLE